jgi:DNA-binding Xre family transcriptional regulator
MESFVNLILTSDVIFREFYDIFNCVMKLKINIREVAENKGIKTAYQLQKRVGLSPSNAAKLYNNDIVQISIETLGKLCHVLECEPSDLFIVPVAKRYGQNKLKS